MRRLALVLALVSSAAMLAQTVDHPLTVGGEVKPPVAIYTPSPEATKAMLKERTRSPVVALIVDEQGLPRDLHLIRSSGSNGFDQAALKAFADYRFKPARLKGTPVAVRLNVEVFVDSF